MSQNRRQFLRALGAGTTGTLVAGCLGGDSSDGTDTPTDSSTTERQPTQTQTQTATKTSASDESDGENAAAAPRVIKMTATGRDIWDSADQGHFYFKWTSGDFDVRTQVTSVENVDSYAKGGIMVRESLEATAPHVFLRRYPNGYITVQWRPEVGASARSVTSQSGRDEREYDSLNPDADWMRLVREGDQIRAYSSTDGEEWKLLADLGPSEVDLSNAVFLGLAGTAHGSGQSAAIKFQNLAGVEPNENADIGEPAVSGSVSVYRPAVVGNLGSTTVSPNAATLTAELEAIGDADSVDVTFRYREVTASEWQTAAETTVSSTGPLRAEISGLTPRRYYEFKVITDNGESTYESPTGIVGTPSGSAGSDAKGPDSASRHDLADGFADVAPWLDDGTPVVKVTEPTREALERALRVSGPRLVVFETSGTIDLGGQHLAITRPKCYVAGQTAPSPGITLARGQFTLRADDCVVQHIRSRPGDAGLSTGWEPNAIQTADGTKNCIIDHCTGTWSVDENISVGYDTENTTISNCLVAEPLHDSTHHKGPHGYSTLIGNRAKRVAQMGNVWGLTTDRNPRLKQGCEGVVVNNVIHYFDDGTWADPDTVHSIEGNVYKQPQTEQPNVFGKGTVYADDNVLSGDADNPMLGNEVDQASSRPRWPEGMTAFPSDQAVSHNIENAGARPADRTEHDERIISMIRNGEGHVIDSQNEVGGYPALAENERTLDIPTSGLRAWVREQAVAVEA